MGDPRGCTVNLEFSHGGLACSQPLPFSPFLLMGILLHPPACFATWWPREQVLAKQM